VFIAGLLTGLLAAGLVIIFTSPPRGHPIVLQPPPTPRPMRVHIAGAVVSPGVYALPPGAILQDALQAAGGASSDAALDAVNLAQPILDGERVYLPSRDELSDDGTSAVPAIVQAQDDSGGDRINLNHATAPELELLPGIGPSLAQKIVDYREAHGDFESVDDLLAVPGIGPAKLEAVRDLVAIR
jgi:competence protein ComEA